MGDSKQHRYEVRTVWTCGADGPPTTYEAYSRNHTIDIAGKPTLAGSSDPAFRGDPSRHNPEDLLVASLSSCHMLWYLHLAVVKKVPVLRYEDEAHGIMAETPRPARFVEVVLRPRVTVARGADLALAAKLHERAHAECFVANSVNFPVRHEPVIVEADS
ncbi:MAG: OsmC family protein [Rhodospirillaceae bacterium]|nr:OsmC family protein [Rhodospirillaceae bacterium]